MSDTFDRAWSDVHKSAFREGRERRRAEAYARIPEMYRRFVDLDEMRQPPAPARRRIAPRRQRATAAPPTQRPRPARRRTRREDPPMREERTATLTPRLPTMIPAPRSPAEAGFEAMTRDPIAEAQDAMEEAPHVDIAYKDGKVVQMPVEDFTTEMITDEVESVFEINEDGESRPIHFADDQPFTAIPGDIQTPASEVIEPTEGVVEQVNKPLGDDMRNISFKKPNQNLANVVKPLMKPSLYEAVGEQHDDLTPEQRRAIVSALERKKVKPTFTEQPKPPTDREKRIQELKDKEAEQPQRMAPKGKGGQKIDKPASQTMTMKDLVKPKKKDEPKQAESEVPRLGSRPKDEDVMKVIEMVQNGNAKAKTELYGALGDLEDMGSSLFDDAQEAIDDYNASAKRRDAKEARAKRREEQSAERKKAQGKDLSKPLTDAKEEGEMTNEDIARRLMGNR